jgi:hypothetical protein
VRERTHAGLPIVNGHDHSIDEQPSLVLRSALEIAARPERAAWLMKPYLEMAALILLVGAEGTYKSFLALHWALLVAMRGSPVIFLHAEGRGLWKRLRAWCLHHYPCRPWGEVLNGVPFNAVERPLNLSSLAVIGTLTSAIDALGRKPALIVVDTMTRNSDGTVERSNEDATVYINMLDMQIRARYGASVILIHHVGHAAKDRARGPFALIASTDANYLLDRSDLERRVVTVRSGRMKDCEPPPPFELEAQIITLDETDEDGKPETSLILHETGAAPVIARKAPTGRNQQLLLGAIREHVRSTGCEIVSSLDLVAIGKAQGLDRKRLPEARLSLQRDGWISEAVGGIKFIEAAP